MHIEVKAGDRGTHLELLRDGGPSSLFSADSALSVLTEWSSLVPLWSPVASPFMTTVVPL